MNAREKKLVIAVGSMAVALFAWYVVVPGWVLPLFDYDQEIARLEADLEDLGNELDQMDALKEKYRQYVRRTGGTNEEEVGDELTGVLDHLVEKCRLENKRLTPKRSVTQGRNGLVKLPYVIKGTGTLEQAVLFLKEFYELPFIARFSDVKIVPKPMRKRGRDVEEPKVDLDATIEVMVPPKFFRPIRDVLEDRPELTKYRARESEFAAIWETDPFTAPVKEPQDTRVVEAEAKGACCVEGECVETNTESECSELGGEWFKFKTCPQHECPTEEPPPPLWEGDPERHQKRVCFPMTPREEVMVVHTASKQREFVQVGEQLDGGELLMVHPYGLLVRREERDGDYDFLYPKGELFADAVALDEALSQPQLRAVAAVAYKFLREGRPQGAEAAEADDRPRERPTLEMAGPPLELAVPLPENRIVASPPLGESGSGEAGSAEMIELAGPPLELAEPPPTDEQPADADDSQQAGSVESAGNVPTHAAPSKGTSSSSVRRVRGAPAGPAQKEPAAETGEGTK